MTSKIPGAKPPVPPKKPDLLLNAINSNKTTNLTPNTKLEHPEWMSFSEKKRHFERATSPNSQQSGQHSLSTSPPQPNHHQQQTKETITKTERYTDTPDAEITTKETLRKVETYSQSRKEIFLSNEELQQIKDNVLDSSKYLASHDHDDDNDENFDEFDNNSPFDEERKEIFCKETTTEDGVTSEHQQKRVFRTAKAEKRYIEKMSNLGIDIQSQEYACLSPGQRRALEAEKRREWRQARLQSLEEDARRTLIQFQNNHPTKENIIEP